MSGGKSLEYKSWASMRQRCRNPNNVSYGDYGGRGIRVCPRWDSFLAFYADLGPRPSIDHTLDRIDSNGHYEPGNVRWVHRALQNTNKRNVKLITWRGETASLHAWATVLGIDYRTLQARRLRNKNISIDNLLRRPGAPAISAHEVASGAAA